MTQPVAADAIVQDDDNRLPSLEELRKEYKQISADYDEFSRACEGILRTILPIKANGTKINAVISRLKSFERVYRKLARYDGRLKRVTDVPDLAGVRVITYFLDGIDDVIGAVNSVFNVLEVDDKRDRGDPRSFGYKGVNIIARLSDDRLNLPENKRFAGFVLEIQVCTLLVHTWSEFEHPHYEGELGVSRKLQRDFAIQAAMITHLDDDFVRVRSQRAEESESQVLADIIANPTSDLDEIALWAFVTRSPNVGALDESIAKMDSHDVVLQDRSFVRSLIPGLRVGGFQRIKDLESLSENEQEILAIAREFSAFRFQGYVFQGTCLRYLPLVVLGSSCSEETAISYFLKQNWWPEADCKDRARALVSAFARKSKGPA